MSFAPLSPDFIRALCAAAAPTLPRVRLFGLDLVNASPAMVVDALMVVQQPQRLTFFNADCANLALCDGEYRAALTSADLILPGGRCVPLAARMARRPLVARHSGPALLPRLLARAARAGRKVFLVGGPPGVAERVVNRLCLAIPGLRIVGTRDGLDGIENETETVAAINASGADIVIAGLGLPHSDVWLADVSPRLTARLTLATGPLRDVGSGHMRRTPRLRGLTLAPQAGMAAPGAGRF
ncbi:MULTISPECIES: WecB/TagA/CpsF family glycosyltransferase [Marinovum]|jgi:exopolysaccharide biosynthesis WecB/TagA/CpsF family protein|uniref:WecB/TagA/CpsF family glycosyltransferase n=1 Tax=Marinovum TaxID=367771 RepID=UPI00237C0AB0|nr:MULTISPECIES: WecB/TagA/CpsF family glycosyltransferase [Marinovum]MDD9741310.1 WecB/TagA/CpsF family glycosyltransferase [Marinovum sp. SP66]MDD9743006.1 WecB/TagA/CpsF family glycosyltransferase [Marinovum sp. PR37]